MLRPGQPVLEWQQGHDTAAVRRLLRKLQREAAGPLVCCYEAGPCGYGLQRQLTAAGIACDVVAPSLIPIKSGERIKTDRRDAKKLAELLRAGLLTAVAPPTADEEDAGVGADVRLYAIRMPRPRSSSPSPGRSTSLLPV